MSAPQTLRTSLFEAAHAAREAEIERVYKSMGTIPEEEAKDAARAGHNSVLIETRDYGTNIDVLTKALERYFKDSGVGVEFDDAYTVRLSW